jgi:hypothetical protein
VVSLVLKFPVTSDAEITFNTFSDTTWVVHAYLPDKTIAHIIPGERIVISLLAYPAEKNGFITGKVQNIHLLKSGQGVNLELTSEKELVTDRHIKIMLVGPMNGRAIIITGYQSLLERIIHGTNR